MSTPAAFKKAMQQLTTTIVKAERADSDERGPLASEVRTQLDALLAIHAEIPADPESNVRPHQGWFEQTVARARAILGEQ